MEFPTESMQTGSRAQTVPQEHRPPQCPPRVRAVKPVLATYHLPAWVGEKQLGLRAASLPTLWALNEEVVVLCFPLSPQNYFKCRQDLTLAPSWLPALVCVSCPLLPCSNQLLALHLLKPFKYFDENYMKKEVREQKSMQP